MASLATLALFRTGRLCSIGVPTSTSLLAKHNNAAAPLVAVIHQQQSRAKSDSLQNIKSGRGGRSSFTGNVVTVFGASGFIGKYIVNRLAKEGNQVIIPYRQDPFYVHKLKVAGDLGQVLFVPIDVRNEESLNKAVKYSNGVINLISEEWQSKNFTFHDINVEACRRIARVCKENGVEKLIHFSHLMASPDPPRCLPSISGDIWKRLEAPVSRALSWPESRAAFLPNGSEFLRSKYAGELAVREEFPEAVIFRPSDVYGAEDRFSQLLCSHWRRSVYGVFPYWKKGEQTIKAPISVHDIATAVMHAYNSKHSAGQTYQCVGPEFYRMDQVIDYLLETCNRHTTHKRCDLLRDPRCLPMWMYCNYMEVLFLNRPQYTWDKFERESMSDVVSPDYPNIEATLPKGYKLRRFPDQVPFEVKHRKKSQFFFQTQDIPNPIPPSPVQFEAAI